MGLINKDNIKKVVHNSISWEKPNISDFVPGKILKIFDSVNIKTLYYIYFETPLRLKKDGYTHEYSKVILPHGVLIRLNTNYSTLHRAAGQFLNSSFPKSSANECLKITGISKHTLKIPKEVDLNFIKDIYKKYRLQIID